MKEKNYRNMSRVQKTWIGINSKKSYHEKELLLSHVINMIVNKLKRNPSKKYTIKQIHKIFAKFQVSNVRLTHEPIKSHFETLLSHGIIEGSIENGFYKKHPIQTFRPIA